MGAVACALVIAVSALADPVTRLKRDEFAFDLPDLTGERVTSEDERFEGKVVLIDIWGTWCVNCRRAIPTLNALHEKYKDEGLVIVGVNFEHEKEAGKRRERALKGIEHLEIEYLILDGGHPDDLFTSLPDLGEIEDIPTVILSGRDGKVRFVKTGFGDGDEAVYEKEIVAALEEK
jgi:thiol-disulfide isomerase/thioredoxin